VEDIGFSQSREGAKDKAQWNLFSEKKIRKINNPCNYKTSDYFEVAPLADNSPNHRLTNSQLACPLGFGGQWSTTENSIDN